MKLKCSEFELMAARVRKNNTRIIMFGAGTIGQVTIPEILKNTEILNMVDCYLDNNQEMWGQKIIIYGSVYEIRPPQYLNECPEGTVILLNISRFSDVLIQLEEMHCTKNMECYIMPMMLIHNFCDRISTGNTQLTDKPIIPRKLHYMWLGKKPISDNLKRCIESWEKYCPDYDIIEWNEDNYDIEKHPYMKQAYASKAYGFVPDYARLDILYNEGGFYLDTDVELKRNIDDLRYQEAFCGVEKWQVINFGGLSGAVKGNPMIKKFINARENIYFLDGEGNENRNTCGFYDTSVAIYEGYMINGKTQCVNGMNIYAYDYFHPYDYMSGIVNETDNTHSVHWFNGGWLDDSMRKANEKTKEQYMELCRRALSE